MRRLRLLTPLFSAALLGGCVSEMVERHKPRKGPVPEVGWVDTGGGEVRYSTEGWGFVVGLRRGSAFRRMKRTCKGLKPKITDEFTHQDVNVPYASDDLAQHLDKGVEHYTVAPYHHIVFDCERPEPPLKRPGAEPLQASTTQQAPVQAKP